MLPRVRSNAARPRALVAALSLVLFSLWGCGGDDAGGGSPTPDSGTDAGPPDSSVPDSSTDGGAPDSSTDATTEGGVDCGSSCACDVTELCDQGCACDLACSALPGNAPLGKDLSTWGRAEIATYLPSALNGPVNRVTLFDDGYVAADGGLPKAYPTLLGPETRPDMAALPIAFGADVDDDGRDEAILATPTDVIVEDWNGTALAPRTVHSYPSAKFWDVAAGDLDYDGGRELVASHQVGTDLTLDVLSLGPTGAATVRATTTLNGVSRHGITIAPEKVDGAPELWVLTGDGKTPETISIRRYTLSGNTLTAGTSLTFTSDCYNPAPDVAMSIAVGNLDTDTDNEIATAIFCKTAGEAVRVLDPLDPAKPADRKKALGNSTIPAPNQKPFLAIGKFGPKPQDVGQVVVAEITTSGDNHDVYGLVHLLRIQGPLLNDAGALGTTEGDSMITGMNVRDLTRDGYDEIVVSRKHIEMSWNSQACYLANPCFPHDNGYRVTVYQPNSSPGSTVVFDDVAQNAGPDASGPGPVVAVGDFDADSLRVRATGKIYQHVARPLVNAVLAAPPTFIAKPGVTQVEGSQTSFGVGTSNTTSDSFNISARAAITISAGLDIDIASIGIAATASAEVTYGMSFAATESYGQETTVGPDTNLVVYRLPIYVSHEYQILSHPDPKQIGKLVLVDVPSAFIDTVRTLEGFRQDFCELADEIVPPTLFQHAIGDPFSYPAFGSCYDYKIEQRVGTGKATYVYQNPTLVDVGQATSGAKTQSISLATQTGQSGGLALGVDGQVSGSIIVGGSVSVGLGASYTHETVIGKDVTYSGTVGYLSSGYDPSTRYQWGLCVYNYSRTVGVAQVANYPVVDYVVTGY